MDIGHKIFKSNTRRIKIFRKLNKLSEDVKLAIKNIDILIVSAAWFML
jgi:hypothetical protein